MVTHYSIIFQDIDEEDLDIILGCFQDYGLDGFEVVEESIPEKVIDSNNIQALRELFELNNKEDKNE